MNVRTASLVEAAAVILALWILIARIPDSLILLVEPLRSEEIDSPYLWMIVTRLLVYLVIGLALLAGRRRLANYVDRGESQVRGDVPTLLSAAIALLGVYFFALGAVALGEALVVQFQDNYSTPWLFARGAFSVLAGLLLFICSGGLSIAWDRLVRRRNAGV